MEADGGEGAGLCGVLLQQGHQVRSAGGDLQRHRHHHEARSTRLLDLGHLEQMRYHCHQPLPPGRSAVPLRSQDTRPHSVAAQDLGQADGPQLGRGNPHQKLVPERELAVPARDPHPEVPLPPLRKIYDLFVLQENKELSRYKNIFLHSLEKVKEEL